MTTFFSVILHNEIHKFSLELLEHLSVGADLQEHQKTIVQDHFSPIAFLLALN